VYVKLLCRLYLYDDLIPVHNKKEVGLQS